MNAFTLFRISVVAPLVLWLAAAVHSFTAEASLSQDWKDLYAWNGDGGIIPDPLEDLSFATWAVIVTFGLIGIAGLVNQVLLFFYWKPSRTIFLVVCVISYASYLLLGLSVMTPLEWMLYELASVFTGICLALAYYSPVARRFSKGPPAEHGGGV